MVRPRLSEYHISTSSSSTSRRRSSTRLSRTSSALARFVHFSLPLDLPPPLALHLFLVYVSLVPFLILLGLKLDGNLSASWKAVFSPLLVCGAILCYLPTTVAMRLWLMSRVTEILPTLKGAAICVCPTLAFLGMLAVWLDSNSPELAGSQSPVSPSPAFSLGTASIPLFVGGSLTLIWSLSA